MCATPISPQDPLNQADAFRGLLAREVPLWEARGLIPPESARAIDREYRLKEVSGESSRLFSRVILGFGGLLIGGGVLAFVAANWEVLPSSGKVGLLFATLLGFHGTGFWLWQERGQERFGRALILAGCLIFGANIGLLAQIFHIQGDTYRGVGAWALGSMAMAWAVQSGSMGLLSLFTSLIWYFGFLESFPRDGTPELLSVVMPITFGGVFLPLAVISASGWLFAFSMLTVLFLAFFAGLQGNTTASVLLTPLAVGFFMWAVGLWLHESSLGRSYGSFTRRLGWLTMAISAWFFAFKDFWKHSSHHDTRIGWLFLVILAFSGAVKLLFDLHRKQMSIERPSSPDLHTSESEHKDPSAGQEMQDDSTLPPKGKTAGSGLFQHAAASFVCIAVVLLGISGCMQNDGTFPVILVNIAALLLAAAEIRSGMEEASRMRFWSGALLIFLLIVSRFLEYETSLLFKSIAFLSCGVLMIYGGTSYETYIKKREIRS
ncbi:MAG: DUF2157 domain-containing protein [Candidatus Riflebacteria bacterium]|nr:DUF2157 domain-containing protein [Candidatus Riflebacteria bacterium]